MASALYGRLEYALYGIVLLVSAGVGVVTERLDFRLQRQLLTTKITEYNQDLAFRLEGDIAQLIAIATGMSAVVALNKDIDERQFADAARRLGADEPAVRSISLATDGTVQHLYPGGLSSPALKGDLRTLPEHLEGMELAKRTGQPVLHGPLDLANGRPGLILSTAFAPTLLENTPSDLSHTISIVVDATKLFEIHTKNVTEKEVLIAVISGDDRSVIWGNPTTIKLNPVLKALTTPSSKWQIASAPVGGWPTLSSNAPTIAGLALLRSLIVCAVIKAMLELLRRRNAAERQLSDAIEALDDGFAVFDPADRLRISNSRYKQIYRTSADLLVPGATFEDILRGGVKRGQYPDAIGQEEYWIQRRLAAHRAGGSVIEQKLDDGRWVRVVERRTGDGSVVGFRVDITELKLATEAAKAAERAKSDFIAVLSHELRTPLTITMGYVSLLAEADKLPVVRDLLEATGSDRSMISRNEVRAAVATIEDMAQRAHKSSIQLLALMNQLLDLSKIEAGKMEVERINLDLADILEDIDNSFRGPVQEKGLRFSVVAIPARVSADPIKIRQILTNLVSNSLKFTEEGYISVLTSIRDGMVLFEVVDSGCGIPADVVNRLFKPFEQVDSSVTRRAKGTGLGLAISKNLVEMMGGAIGFENNHPSGTLFWFTVPLAVS